MNRLKKWHEYLFPRFRIIKWQWINEGTWTTGLRFTVEKRKRLFKYSNAFFDISPYESIKEARYALAQLYKKHKLEKTIVKRQVVR